MGKWLCKKDVEKAVNELDNLAVEMAARAGSRESYARDAHTALTCLLEEYQTMTAAYSDGIKELHDKFSYWYKQ